MASFASRKYDMDFDIYQTDIVNSCHSVATFYGGFMVNAVNQLVVDLELIRRLDKNGPRYTSYPTADPFVEAFNPDTYAQWVAKREIGGIARPLSLYVHIPFCNTLCFYCACNKVITKDKSKAAE